MGALALALQGIHMMVGKVFLNVFSFLYSFGIDYHSTSLDVVVCSSSQYLNILQCSYRTQPSCIGDNRDAFVTCCESIMYIICHIYRCCDSIGLYRQNTA